MEHNETISRAESSQTLDETPDNDSMDVDADESVDSATRITRSGKSYATLTHDRQELSAEVGKSNELEGADDAGLIAILMALDNHIEQEAEEESVFLITLNGLLDLGPRGRRRCARKSEC